MAFPPRLCVDAPLAPAQVLALPPEAARHVQVLRLQPGDALRLFDGSARPGSPGGGDWPAVILRMGRQSVEVELGPAPTPVDRELPCAVTLALGMPANERMDSLVEKATELGVAAIQPLVCARSVLRLSGERALKKQAHWQGIARAAAEQCGRARLPQVHAVMPLAAWLAQALPGAAGLLSLDPQALALPRWLAEASAAGPLRACSLLSGPEGGLTPEEEGAARDAGLVALSLGPRILRADTAPLAALALIGALA